jgi:hypothetical protein
MEIVMKNTQLMLSRRGFTDIKIVKTEEKYNMTAISKKNTKVLVFFVNKEKFVDEKITTSLFKQFMVTAVTKDIFHLIIIHEIPLTSDAKQNISTISKDNNSIYCFETFDFEEMSFDLFESLFLDKNNPENVKFCEPINDKISIISSKDILSRYIGAKHGDFLIGFFEGLTDFSYRKCLDI